MNTLSETFVYIYTKINLIKKDESPGSNQFGLFVFEKAFVNFGNFSFFCQSPHNFFKSFDFHNRIFFTLLFDPFSDIHHR